MAQGDLYGLLELESIFSGFEHFDLAGVEERTRLAVQIWAETLANPTVRALQVETIEIVRTAFAHAVRQRQASGELDLALHPDAAARAMIALFQGPDPAGRGTRSSTSTATARSCARCSGDYAAGATPL